MADRSSLVVSLATGLAAGFVGTLVISAWEASSIEAGFFAALVSTAGLYALLALGLGGALGIVANAFHNQFGAGAVRRLWRRLSSDSEVEAAGVGAVVAAAVAAALLAAVVFAGAVVLVAGVERKGVGALLLAVVVAAALPFVALAALPAYRAGRKLAPLVPRIGPVPRPAVLALAGLLVIALAGAFVVITRLDWRALPLGLPTALLVLSIIIIGAYVGLARLRDKPLIIGGLASAVVGLGLVFGGTSPGSDTARAIAETGRGTPALVSIARRLIDGDGDGFSAFFSGPDCDDGNPDVNPGAAEVPGNGIDDNCLGGDRALPAAGGDGPDKPDQPDNTVDRPDLPTAKNALLIIIDTLRADRLGVTGYKREGKSLTPNLDKLIGQSAYFEKVWAQAPNTPRSFPSMFTSRFPSQVAVDKSFKNYSTVLPENVTIFEVLKDAGILTSGFSSHFYFKEERGIRQGFAEYNNDGAKDIAGSNKDIASPRTVPLVNARLSELGASGERFAMFVHLFEPHSTYLAHDEWPIKSKGTDSLAEKYDWEIKFVDRWVGKVLEGLEAAKLADDTVVIIASDHGEAFGVHRFAGRRMFFHGQTLYDELLRVPLIISMPGAEPARISEPIMMMDLAPTMAAALDIDPAPSFVGRSVWPAVHGKPIEARPVYAQLIPAPSWKHEAVMMVAANAVDKVIYRISERAWELYNLGEDPEERVDRARGNAGKLNEMKEKLGHFLEVELVQ